MHSEREFEASWLFFGFPIYVQCVLIQRCIIVMTSIDTYISHHYVNGRSNGAEIRLVLVGGEWLECRNRFCK